MVGMVDGEAATNGERKCENLGASESKLKSRKMTAKRRTESEWPRQQQTKIKGKGERMVKW